MKVLFLATWLSIGVVAAAAQTNDPALVDKGRVALGQACVQCHNLRGIQSQRKSAQQWRDTVYGMISRGSMVLPDEIEPITAYLATTFGPNSPRPSSPNQAPGGAAPQLPDSEGRAILERSCIQCHDMQTTTAKVASREEWGQIMARMIDAGARISPAEQQTLIQYLTSLAR